MKIEAGSVVCYDGEDGYIHKGEVQCIQSNGVIVVIGDDGHCFPVYNEEELTIIEKH